MIRSKNLVSTHIRGAGHALFHLRDHRLELHTRSPEDAAVDGSWINRTGLIAEGLPMQPYIHLDIRTPFGESVGNRQIEEALAESLGPRRDRYRVGGWHIQFVEDTNLGSNHRVFVDLIESGSGTKGLAGMDSGLSLELAMEALGDLLAAEKGESNFQFLYGGEGFCYSLLHLNGSAFHVLRVGFGASDPKAAPRLRRHRDCAAAFGKTGGSGLKTFLGEGDPLLRCALIKELSPELFKLPAVSAAGKNPAASRDDEATGARANEAFLHLGVAHAARQRDFHPHNRVEESRRRRNEVIRTRHRFGLAMAATLAGCLAVSGAFAYGIRATQTRLAEMEAKAASYRTQVETIRTLRVEKASLEAGLAKLRPVWNRPMDWNAVFAGIASSLPKEAGIDGLAVARNQEGGLDLSFRAWVKNWDQVREIQKKLSGSKPFRGVALSEQRKDMSSGAVIFHVTCGLERN